MRKLKFLSLLILVLLLIIACTPETTKPDDMKGKDILNSGDETPKPILSHEVPLGYPEDVVPLYDIDDFVHGVVAGENYYQVYYHSSIEPNVLFEHYDSIFKDASNVKSHDNGDSYEFEGKKDNYNIKVHIVPSNKKDFKSTIFVFLSGVNSEPHDLQ